MKLTRRQLRNLINETVMQESFSSWLASVLPKDKGVGAISNRDEGKAKKAAKKIKDALKKKELKASVSVSSKSMNMPKKGTVKGYYIQITNFDKGTEAEVKNLYKKVKVNTKQKFIFVDP